MASAARSNSPLRGDMSNILVLEPMIAFTALFMEHRDIQHDAPGHVAATDGRQVTVWPAYHRMRTEARAAVLLHEYLHAAFAHPLRAMKLRLRLGAAFRMDVLNIAADAIINEGVRHMNNAKIVLPDDAIKLQTIAEQAKAIVELTGVDVDVERMKSVGRLTLEWMYDAMMRLEEAARSACGGGGEGADGGSQTGTPGSPGTSEGSSGNNGTPAGAEGTANDNAEQDPKDVQRRKAAQDYLDQFGKPGDMDLSELNGMTAGDVDDGIRGAGEKLRNAAAMGKARGSGRGSAVEALLSDIPTVNTPWEASFRSITQRHLARSRERRPSKPGRRVLTQEAMSAQRIVWSAGRRRPPVPRVIVVLDSSGSIRPDEYIRYLSEIQAMKRRTNAQVFAIVADAKVQSVQEIKDARDLASVEFKGRGGTDFRPAIALAEEMEADLLVYLTDLMGTFPAETPSFPVLWTLPGMETPSGYEPPFGRVLLLD